MKKLLTIAVCAFVFASCNNQSTPENIPGTNSGAVTPFERSTPEGTFEINAGDDMKYDTKEIKVKEGQAMTVILHHTGKASKEAMGHNFVLLKEGVNMEEFDAKAMQDKDNDYIPKGTDEVIAHTKLLGGGESDTIEFPAPPKGTYNFLCTFPGHGGVMNGKLIVE